MPSGGTSGTSSAPRARRGSCTRSGDTSRRKRGRSPTFSGGNSRRHRNRLNNPRQSFRRPVRRLCRGRKRPGRSTTPWATFGCPCPRDRHLRRRPRARAPQTSGLRRTGTRLPTRKPGPRVGSSLRRPSRRATRYSIHGRAGACVSRTGRAASRVIPTARRA